MSAEEAFATEDETLKKTRAKQVIAAFPGIGIVATEQIMEELGIDEKRRVGGLGANQRKRAIELVSGR